MATLIGTEAKFETMLADLIRLDFDAAAAYQSAIDRLDKETSRAAMRRFKADHRRHTREIGACLRDRGHQPPKAGDMKQWLTTGKVVVAGVIGDDAIIAAMRTNEDDTVTAYDRAVKHPDCPDEVLRILKSAQRDEHRHRDWMVRALKSRTGTAARRAPRRAPSRSRKTVRRPVKKARRPARAKRRSSR
jgi:uncharacterized protein (TIGR02284 family)